LYGTRAGFQDVIIEVINVPNLPPKFTSRLSATIKERRAVCIVSIFLKKRRWSRFVYILFLAVKVVCFLAAKLGR